MFGYRKTGFTNHKINIIFGVGFILMLFLFARVDANPADLLDSARVLFYRSIEEKQHLDQAVYMFNRLKTYERYTGLAETYLGALTALEGKYAFLPTTKYNKAIKGLEKMDKGVEISPDNLEARFIRGTTCYYLPFFFNRQKTAEEDFQVILTLLEQHYDRYNPELVSNVIDFLQKNTELTPRETKIVERVGDELKEKRASG